MAIKVLKSFLALLNLRPLGWTSVSVTYGSRESDAGARDSLIFFVTQAASYSCAYRVNCKVKCFGKVANVLVRIRGEDNILHAHFMWFAALSFQGPNQLSAVDYA